MRILLVEDDPVIAESLVVLLKSNGYVVDHEATKADALQRLDVETYDCLIIDRGLPDGDGIDIVVAARKTKERVSILILTAKNQSTAMVEGLDAGADDYLPKPFLPTVLLARVRALVRRKDRLGGSPILIKANITINTNTHVVTRDGKIVELSPKEFELLKYLLIHPGEAIDRQTLLDMVWGEETDMFSNTVDVHIRYLRKKLDSRNQKSMITTIRGKGYMICDA